MKGARHDQKQQADSAGEPTGRDDGNTVSLEMKVTFREAPSLAKNPAPVSFRMVRAKGSLTVHDLDLSRFPRIGHLASLQDTVFESYLRNPAKT